MITPTFYKKFLAHSRVLDLTVDAISNPKAIKVIMLPSTRFSDIISTPQCALSDGSSHTPRSLLRKLLSVMTPAPVDSPQTPQPFIFTPLSKETPHGLVTDPYCSFTESSVTSLYSPLAASTPNGYDSYTYISSSFTINSPDLPVLRDSFPPPLILDDEYPVPASPAVVEPLPLMKPLTPRPSFSWKPLRKSTAHCSTPNTCNQRSLLDRNSCSGKVTLASTRRCMPTLLPPLSIGSNPRTKTPLSIWIPCHAGSDPISSHNRTTGLPCQMPNWIASTSVISQGSGSCSNSKSTECC